MLEEKLLQGDCNMWQQTKFGFQNISKLLQGDGNGSRKGSDQHLVVSSRRPNQRLRSEEYLCCTLR